jgi:hypothetical protein
MRFLFLAILALATWTPVSGAIGPRLQLDAKVTWREPGETFGGFSGLVIVDGGNGLVTISDRGTWARASIERKDGSIVAVRQTDRGPLRQISGGPVSGGDVDAEGLTIDPRGRVWVSFEHFHRVRSYGRIDGPAAGVPGHPDFTRRLQDNSGLEALASDDQGTIYAIPERSGRPIRPFKVYRLRSGEWDVPFAVRRDGPFLVSDAAIGPDGDLYVLERDFSWVGFRSRVRRFSIAPEGLRDEVTLLTTGYNALDNMEGISVWRDPEGQIRVTLISDDNFFPLQKTMLAEYVLAGG